MSNPHEYRWRWKVLLPGLLIYAWQILMSSALVGLLGYLICKILQQGRIGGLGFSAL